MLVHKGGHWVRIAEMSQLQNCSVKIFKEHSSMYFTRKRNGGCQLRRIERWGEWSGGGGVDMYEELVI